MYCTIYNVRSTLSRADQASIYQIFVLLNFIKSNLCWALINLVNTVNAVVLFWLTDYSRLPKPVLSITLNILEIYSKLIMENTISCLDTCHQDTNNNINTYYVLEKNDWPKFTVYIFHVQLSNLDKVNVWWYLINPIYQCSTRPQPSTLPWQSWPPLPLTLGGALRGPYLWWFGDNITVTLG